MMEDSQFSEENIKIEKEDTCEESIEVDFEKIEADEMKFDLDNKEVVDLNLTSQNGVSTSCGKQISVSDKPTCKVEIDCDESSVVSTIGMEEQCQNIAVNDDLNSFDNMADVNSLEETVVDKYNYSETAHSRANFEIEQVFIKEELCDANIEDRSIGNDLKEIELGINKKITSSNISGMDNIQLETVQSCNELSEEEANSLFPNEASTTYNNEANSPSLAAKFNINRSAIESVSKENQASELRSIEGLSVYDQSTLEAGILLQVDQALEKEASGQSHSDETEMERQIRQGEITPFGTCLGETLASGTTKTSDGLSVIEKYLSTQLELQGKRKRKIEANKNSSGKQQQPQVKMRKKEAKHDSQKSKIFNIHSKKKKRKKDTLGTETQDCVPQSVSPDPVPGEQATMAHDDASDSEYLPSDSDYIPSSEDEKRDNKLKEKKDKPPANKNKRKLPYTKSYKIPEDWATDDSDWEYSDEEGNFKKNKRSKKELDDGDVDIFNRRIRIWKQERKQAGVSKDAQLYHKLNEDFKLPQDMWDKLYNYQRVGVQWLWELDQQMCGGILGDEMGLGKTIQVVAFLAGLHVSDLKDKDTNYRGLGPTLIVCPTTVMHQWVREFHEWYPPIRVAILHESGTFCGKQRRRLIVNIVQAGGVLITSYTGATQLKDDIISRSWHYVVLDEGHKIRNPDAQITLMVKQLQTTHRIILSGSPMQNNLKELWSLFDFVFPGKLGTLPVFLEQFAVPITQGGYANASQVQVMTAFKCATVLKETMAPFLLRRMKADVKSHIKLPEKNEQVLFCRLTDEQRHYYKDYVESGEVSRILEGRLKIFVGLINLRKICNHPDLYIGPKPGEREEGLPDNEQFGHWSKSGKMIVVETLLKLWHKQGHRVLVFTQSRQMLSIMESFVRQSGYKYLKLDGTTSIAARQPLINNFNQDTSYFLMLLTTRVGGLGVNLTGANRVLIYDPDWNPATDTQARERAWRIGQRQSVTVYRLITAGTIEEKMYHRQIFKQFLCNKVLKDPRQRRFFKSNDLYELFALKETDVEGSTETGAIFAGTGSEVKLDPTKTYKHCKIDPKLSAEPPPKTFSRKAAEKKKMMEQKLKEKSEKIESTSKGEVNFSNEKIEHMKKLAQMLSQKIFQTTLPEKNNLKDKSESGDKKCENVVLIDNEISNSNLDLSIPVSTDNGDCSPEIPSSLSLETPKSKNILQKISVGETSLDKSNVSSPSSSNSSASLIKSVKSKTHKHKRKHKDKKKKRGKDANFEGETVPHLVRTGESTSVPSEDKDNAEKYATQDEYVLHKLFARSGLQTALKHDTIMEGGPADYALVEVEADRVAQQAVEKLKESRRECWQATSGIPNFTGQNGARNFQLQKRPGKTKSSVAEWSSSAILEQIRKRNCAREVKDPEIILVQDIREFVSSQGGTVHTTQLIDRFEGRLPEGSSPLFKSLLAKICTFYRAPDKLGYWTLKEEFNW